MTTKKRKWGIKINTTGVQSGKFTRNSSFQWHSWRPPFNHEQSAELEIFRFRHQTECKMGTRQNVVSSSTQEEFYPSKFGQDRVDFKFYKRHPVKTIQMRAQPALHENTSLLTDPLAVSDLFIHEPPLPADDWLNEKTQAIISSKEKFNKFAYNFMNSVFLRRGCLI